MNIQAMMKQAQKLQSEMMKEKKAIDETVFEHTTSFVTVKASGDKKITDIKIDMTEISSEDMETVQDLIMITVNEVMNKIDKLTEEKMGKYSQGLPGLF